MSAPIDLAFTGRACSHWAHGDFCRSTDRVRAFGSGPRCGRHTPAALAGEPEPDELLARAQRIRAGLIGADS